MKTSRSAEYALAAVCYIAEHQEERGAVLSDDISKSYKISRGYLRLVLEELVKAHVLVSKRGPKGGFLLARNAKTTTMLEVIEAIDGPVITKVNIGEQRKREKFKSKAERACEKGIGEARKVLEGCSIADLVVEG